MWWLCWLDPPSCKCYILGCQEQILCRPPELGFEGHTSRPYLLPCRIFYQLKQLTNEGGASSKVSAWRAAGLASIHALPVGIFSRLTGTSDLQIGTPVATLPSAGNGWPNVNILWLGESKFDQRLLSQCDSTFHSLGGVMPEIHWHVAGVWSNQLLNHQTCRRSDRYSQHVPTLGQLMVWVWILLNWWTWPANGSRLSDQLPMVEELQATHASWNSWGSIPTQATYLCQTAHVPSGAMRPTE